MILQHQSIATNGLYPGASILSIATLGISPLAGENVVETSSPGRAFHRNFYRDRVERDDTITMMLSYNGLYWHHEYKDVPYSKVAVRARLHSEKKVQREKKVSTVSVKASINKPTVKAEIKK